MIYLSEKDGVFPTVMIGGVKQVDLADPAVIEYENNARSRSEDKPVKVAEQKPAQKSKSGKVTAQKKSEIKDPVVFDEPKRGKNNDPVIPPEIIEKLEKNQLTAQMILSLPKAWVEKIKLYEQVKSISQKRRHDRRELIARKMLRMFCGKLYEIDMNEFMSVKIRAIPELAKIFKCTDEKVLLEAEKAIDDELWSVLSHVKIEIDRFIKSIGAEPIDV